MGPLCSLGPRTTAQLAHALRRQCLKTITLDVCFGSLINVRCVWPVVWSWCVLRVANQRQVCLACGLKLTILTTGSPRPTIQRQISTIIWRKLDTYFHQCFIFFVSLDHQRGRGGEDRMVVGYTTIYAISAYHH